MANFSAKAPVEQEKLGAYLHDRTRLPASPRPSLKTIAANNWGLIAGVLLAAGMVALAFQVRDGWTNHREWVVATTVPFLAITGLAIGYLIARGKDVQLAPSIFFLALTLVLTLSSAWVGAKSNGHETTQDVLTILAGVCLGITVLSTMITLVVVEWRNPPKAPTPAE